MGLFALTVCQQLISRRREERWEGWGGGHVKGWNGSVDVWLLVAEGNGGGGGRASQVRG